MTTTTTLSSWLLDQIAADEEVALEVAAWRVRIGEDVGQPVEGEDRRFFAGYDSGGPSVSVGAERVLDLCAAHRQIVELHDAYDTPQQMTYGTIVACAECGSVDDSPVAWPCPTLRALATAYADRPGYREEWRP